MSIWRTSSKKGDSRGETTTTSYLTASTELRKACAPQPVPSTTMRGRLAGSFPAGPVQSGTRAVSQAPADRTQQSHHCTQSIEPPHDPPSFTARLNSAGSGAVSCSLRAAYVSSSTTTAFSLRNWR